MMDQRNARARECFVRFARLGVSAFGGPVAHLAYFRREFVERARWLDDAAFSEIVALCSALPGPTSSQVGIVLGFTRAGPLGAFLAWFAFTAPSALALALFGLVLHAQSAATLQQPLWTGALSGLAGAAAAVVALAVVTLARSLAATRIRAALAAAAFALALGLQLAGVVAAQIVPLALGGIVGAYAIRDGRALPGRTPGLAVSRTQGLTAILVYAGLLALGAFVPAGSGAALAATCYRAGALVFGGGHVVLPFLQSEVSRALIAPHVFLAGYGAAQAVPGPLFTFAAFLGAVNRSELAGPLGALVATLSIFAPSFLLLAAAVPVWQRVRTLPRAPGVLAGLGAAVVGLLAAALVDPVATSIAHDRIALAAGVVALPMLWRTRVPSYAVVAGCAAAGAAAARLLH